MRGRSTQGLGPEELAKLRRDHIGFIFQSYHLFPTLTARKMSVWFSTFAASDPKALGSKPTRHWSTVGLAHKTKSYPVELSGGEQQRVAIARAIAGKASAILADEPTAALDSENGYAIMTILASIAKDPNRAVLVVSHDPRILPFANRVVRIEDGRIVGEERRDAGGYSKSEVELAFHARSSPTCSIWCARSRARAGRCSPRSSFPARCPTSSPA